MKMNKLILAGMLWASAFGATAGQLAGKNIILIQGFQFQQVFLSRSHDGGKRFGYNYWNKFGLYNNGNGAVQVGKPWGITLKDQNLPKLKDSKGEFNIFDTSREAVYYNDANAKILYYDSSFRLEEKNGQGVGTKVAQQIKNLFKADPNYCKRTNGCIVITHSTGDLVMQYIESNKSTLLDSATRNAFDVLTYVDMAGAGGGTEGASWLFGVAKILNGLTKNSVLSPENQNDIDNANTLLNLLFGSKNVSYIEPGKHFQTGILEDLQVHEARNMKRVNADRIPKLRVASAGDEPYGFVTHLVIRGHDDSVVPLHSACGSSYAAAFNSCVWNRTLTGKVTLFADAPHDYYPHHYPLIQSDQLRHNGHQWNDKGNTMVPLMGNGEIADDVSIQLAKKTTWDIFGNRYIRVRDAHQKTMAQVLSSSIK